MALEGQVSCLVDVSLSVKGSAGRIHPNPQPFRSTSAGLPAACKSRFVRDDYLGIGCVLPVLLGCVDPLLAAPDRHCDT